VDWGLVKKMACLDESAAVGLRRQRFLEELRLLLNRQVGLRRGISEYIDDILAYLRLNQAFQIKEMGCWAGAFTFVNPITLEVCPLIPGQPMGGSAEESMEILNLPYSWNSQEAERYENLLDEMFHTWRSSAALRCSPDRRRWLPEYYVQLTEKEAPFEAVSLDDANDVWQATGCLYCDWGEVLFFMLAWRLLLRVAQYYGWDTDPALAIQGIGPARPKKGMTQHRSIWSPSFWADLPDLPTRESLWSDHVQDLGESRARLWKEITEITDDEGQAYDPWVKDWETLRLLKEEEGNDGELHFAVGKAMHSLVSYCQYELEKLGEGAEVGTMRDRLNRLTGNVSITREDFADIDAIVKLSIMRVLRSAGSGLQGSLPTGRYLEHLHKVARFPVLPYFYWYAVDPGERTHCVIPVWRSIEGAVGITGSLPDPSHCSGSMFIEGSAKVTNIVGVAVVGLKPIEAFDRTCGRETSDSVRLLDPSGRFNLVRDFFELLAQPLGDLYFYSRLAASHREAEADIVADMDHRLGNIRSAYAGIASVLRRAGKADNLEKKQHILRTGLGQIERINKEFDRYLAKVRAWKRMTSTAQRDIDLVRFIASFVDEADKSYPLSVKFVCEPYIPVFRIWGQKDALWWLLDELVYNANKILWRKVKNPMITFSLSEISAPEVLAMPRGQRWLRIEVSDNGPGIDPDLIGKIFDKGVSGLDGTGYGLYRARKIVQEGLGGRIYDSTNENGGATFILEIPGLE
jgi:signal transduction histidine kinase